MNLPHSILFSLPRRMVLCGPSALLCSVLLTGCGGDNAGSAARKTRKVDPVIGIAVSPDGRIVACCNRNNTLTLRDTATLKTVRTLTFGTRAPVIARFHPRGNALLVGYYDGTATLWDLNSDAEEPVLLGTHDLDIRSAAFSNDGRSALTGDGAGNVILWKIGDGGYRIHRHQSAVWSLAFSKDDRQFLCGDSGGRIREWDTATGEPLRTLKAHNSPVRSLAMSADGKSFVSAGLDSMIRWWDFAQGREMWSVRSPGNGLVTAVLSPDGKSIASASVFSGNIRIWNIASKKITSTIPAHEVMASDLGFCRDGTLVSCGMDGDVHTWLIPDDGEHPPTTSPQPPAVTLNGAHPPAAPPREDSFTGVGG